MKYLVEFRPKIQCSVKIPPATDPTDTFPRKLKPQLPKPAAMEAMTKSFNFAPHGRVQINEQRTCPNTNPKHKQLNEIAHILKHIK